MLAQSSDQRGVSLRRNYVWSQQYEKAGRLQAAGRACELRGLRQAHSGEVLCPSGIKQRGSTVQRRMNQG